MTWQHDNLPSMMLCSLWLWRNLSAAAACVCVCVEVIADDLARWTDRVTEGVYKTVPVRGGLSSSSEKEVCLFSLLS